MTARKPAPNCVICGQPCRRPYAQGCSDACRRQLKRARDKAHYDAHYKTRYAANAHALNARSRAYYAAHRETLLQDKRQRYIARHKDVLIRCRCGTWFHPSPRGRDPRYFCSDACRQSVSRAACAQIVHAYYAAFRGHSCSLSNYQSLPLIETAMTRLR